MRWNSLVSIHNLKLAWRRINTACNVQYKRFFRDAYLVYESSLDENLKALKQRLDAKAWEPSHATRIYLPKPSGLQRPLSFLELEDQIVLQAISNQFANKLRIKRKAVEDSTVFSNILTQDASSIFFTERWQKYYRSFQQRCEVLYAFGDCQWVGHFDLAAYYDTISHDLLIASVYPSIESNVTSFLKRCFQTWSANDIQAMTGHGLPQGPAASDFLADGFFLPIDTFLTKISNATIRYVDDIRIFGKTENEVRRVAIQLEQECRHRGLIPQSSKFEVKKLNSIKDALGSMPSIPPSDPNAPEHEEMEADYALKMLESTLGGRPLKVQDKSRFRYVMYRAPADNRILNRVLQLLPRHPEHVDAFVSFFGNYGNRRRIARSALEVLRDGVPYSYIRGELWHVVARLGDDDTLKEGLELAKLDAKDRQNCAVLSWGVMHFLLKCDQKNIAGIGRRLNTEHSISRALLGPQLPEREFAADRVVAAMLRGSTLEQMSATRQMQLRGRRLNSVGLQTSQLPDVCQNALRGLGVIQNRSGTGNQDWISKHLVELYGCRDDKIWKRFLGPEFGHALQILIEAKVRYAGAYSEWLSLQDSFNDILVRSFIAYLASKTLPGGHQRLVASDGKLIKFGNLIGPNSPMEQNFNVETIHLRTIHKRRNQLPGSHPYDERGGAKSRFLKKPERNQLYVRQKAVLDSLLQYIHTNGI